MYFSLSNLLIRMESPVQNSIGWNMGACGALHAGARVLLLRHSQPTDSVSGTRERLMWIVLLCNDSIESLLSYLDLDLQWAFSQKMKSSAFLHSSVNTGDEYSGLLNPVSIWCSRFEISPQLFSESFHLGFDTCCRKLWLFESSNAYPKNDC